MVVLIALVFSFLSVILLSQSIFRSSLAQDKSDLLTQYKNPVLGIQLSYPSTWYRGTPGNNYECSDLCHETWQLLDRPDAPLPDGTMVIQTYNSQGPTILKCKCNSLIKFMKFRYGEIELEEQANNLTLINDNKTEIGKNYSAWQIEYMTNSFPKKALKNFAYINNTFYEISYYADEPMYSKHLHEVKKIIDSISFVALQKLTKKIPSFMRANNTEGSSMIHNESASSATKIFLIDTIDSYSWTIR